MKFLLRLLGKLNIFRNMRITFKLGMLTVLVLLGFTAIFGAYLYQQQVTGEVQAQAQVLQKFAQANENVRANVLTSQDLLKEFFLTKDQAILSRFNGAINDANNGSAELEKLAQNERQQTVIYQLRDAISRYQRSARAAADAEIELGLDQDSGLQGAMRNVVHEIEAQLNEYDEPVLQVSMLRMRQHEKDFLQRETDNYADAMAKEQNQFKQLLQASTIPAPNQSKITDLMANYQQAFLNVVEGVKNANEQVAQVNQQQALVAPLVATMGKVTQQTEDSINRKGAALVERINALFLSVLVAVGSIVILSLIFLAIGITRSLGRLRSTVAQVTEGDLDARVELASRDELGQLGGAFDSMLDERVSTLARAQQESDQLNNSVIQLMDAADRLSQRDLTVRVPVNADATGNISDALNMMTKETAHTIGEVNSLAAQLEQAANVVQSQGRKVADVAANERMVVGQALEKLEQSTSTMAEMAELAVSSNTLAGSTVTSTKRAVLAVRNTVASMNNIRSGVSETEKSIKRLGERSQEISSVVDIIKDISERTHTLALNAGMQAVAAGEAGRGFSVVADEVQRLAETARDSTEQIATLMRSIQAESAETMATMNKTIGQVVEGSALAENAGKRMRMTHKATQKLVAAVEQIAEKSTAQVEITDALRGQATELQQSTEATEQELHEQATQTESMFEYLQSLVQAVRVFKLPNAA